MFLAVYLMAVNAVAVVIAAGGGSDDPSVWVINFMTWLTTKGGTILLLVCGAIALWGVGVFVTSNHRKGLIRTGVGLVGAMFGGWIISGGAMTFLHGFGG